MIDNEKRVREAEGFAGLRRLLLIVNAVAYVAAIAVMGLSHAGVHGFESGQWKETELAAWAVWGLSLLGIFWTIRRATKRPDIGALVNDERTAGMASKAFQAGYWALLLSVAGVFMATYFTPFDIKLVLPFMLALGVAAPPLTFALLYRD